MVQDDPEQSDSHYNAHYTRSSTVLTHASQLSDALTLLGQACAAMVTGMYNKYIRAVVSGVGLKNKTTK